MSPKSQKAAAKVIGLDEAREAETLRRTRALPDAVSLDDFYAYMPMHRYIFAPTGDMWPASSVNKRVPLVKIKGGKKPIVMSASDWIDKNQPVEQMTWAPGLPMLIRDRIISGGGWITRPGCTVFNLYRPPTIVPGDPAKADRWREHVKRVYPDDHLHIVDYLAHRVQKPGEKINHALVLGGEPGIGKDSILTPVIHAIGAWNFEEIFPNHLFQRFNSFVKSVILRINEAHDPGEVDRYAFYERSKAYTAAPPDVIRCDEKNIREHPVPNVSGIIITTNHRDSLYLPANDRRHYVAYSECVKNDFTTEYWNSLHAWYEEEGNRHVAAFLARHDISRFNAKAPPSKTPAFWAMVDATRPPESAELSDTLDVLKTKLGIEQWPAAITLGDLIRCAEDSFLVWLKDPTHRRLVRHRLADAGYTSVRNPDDKRDGQWQIGKRRQTIYSLRTLGEQERYIAARKRAELGH